MKPSAPIFASIALILLQLYSCASPSSLSGPDNSTVGYKQKFLRHELPICTNNSAWLSDQFWIASTCVIALSALRDNLYKIHERRKFLFYDVEDPPPIASVKQATPLKFFHDDCTIAVIMLKRFAPGRLPGKSSRTQTFSLDDASWQELTEAGTEKSIGIFMWGTGSPIDLEFPDLALSPDTKAVNASAPINDSFKIPNRHTGKLYEIA
ncbi:MAG: hypothetical protein Q9164_001981 [Protoblastenia rupestris]